MELSLNLSQREAQWVDVVIPNPKPVQGKVSASAIAAAVAARKARTAASKARLLEILKVPPTDFDGSNAKLAEHLGMSERSVTRLLGLLAKDGVIRFVQNTNVSASGIYVKRFIQLLKRD